MEVTELGQDNPWMALQLRLIKQAGAFGFISTFGFWWLKNSLVPS